MGQYYYPVNIDKIEYLYSHDYNGNGLKLMEHSYQTNRFVGAVLKLLMPRGRWHKNRLIWAGDYGEKTFNDFKTGDPVVDVVQDIGTGRKNIHAAVQDIPEAKLPGNLRGLTKKEWDTLVVVNHTKKQYYTHKSLTKTNPDDYVICPLPLLTSDGNGSGGGDYDGEYMSLVGLWAGDVISVEKETPIGYEDIEPDFKENR